MVDIESDEVALILSGVRILQHLDTVVIEDIARRMQVAEFKPGAKIVEYGQPGSRLYILFRGKAEVLLPGKAGQVGRRVDLYKGDVIGEISLLTGNAYGADVIARDEVTALCLERPQFRTLVEQYKPFAESMTELMRERLAQNGGINQVGKYQLLEKLGEGNTALVFSAHDPELDREVAIKMLKYKLACNPAFLQRFKREALMIAGLHHPHIINVYEIIHEYSTSFIVMEKLEGQSLLDRLQQQGAFSIPQARDILQQVASALQYAHQHGENGIVHRDVKPSNIIIDAFGNIKLTDFGIAGPPQEPNLKVEGTPSYLAPEVISGAAVDGRADIYALGVMAFHMLTNSLPFSASALDKILVMQLRQSPPDIRNHCPELDDAFAEFIQRALEKDLDKRISDWSEIHRLLAHGAGQELISLAPNEMGVVIRLRDVAYSDAARIINAMQRMLRDSEVDYSIKMQRGDSDS